MADVHENMIREREAKRDKLQSQLDAINAEIKVLKEAQFLMSGEKPARTRKTSTTRERALLDKWANVLKAIGNNGDSPLDPFIYNIAEDIDVSKDTMRGQMAYYERQGLLERVSSGVYKLTELGAEKCGYKTPKQTYTGYDPNDEIPF